MTDDAKIKLERVAGIADAMAASNDPQVIAFGMEIRATVDYEDEMPAGFNRPIRVDKTILVTTLRNVAAHVEADDSAGGFVEYEWSETPGKYDVRASYRVGNLLGQGGLRILHEERENDGSSA